MDEGLFIPSASGWVKFSSAETVRGQLRALGSCFGEQEGEGIGVRGLGEVVEGGLEGGARSVACKWFMGVYAAHGEMELGVKHVRLKENKCIRLARIFHAHIGLG